MELFDECNATAKVGQKVWMLSFVLTGRTVATTVFQNRLEPIIVSTSDIDPAIDNDSRQMLPNAFSHNSRFSMVHDESLFCNSGSDVDKKAFRAAGKVSVA
jgi:hypothetical protein